MFTSILKCADSLLVNVQFQEGTLTANYLRTDFTLSFFMIKIKDCLDF